MQQWRLSLTQLDDLPSCINRFSFQKIEPRSDSDLFLPKCIAWEVYEQ